MQPSAFFYFISFHSRKVKGINEERGDSQISSENLSFRTKFREYISRQKAYAINREQSFRVNHAHCSNRFYFEQMPRVINKRTEMEFPLWGWQHWREKNQTIATAEELWENSTWNVSVCLFPKYRVPKQRVKFCRGKRERMTVPLGDDVLWMACFRGFLVFAFVSWMLFFPSSFLYCGLWHETEIRLTLSPLWSDVDNGGFHIFFFSFYK